MHTSTIPCFTTRRHYTTVFILLLLFTAATGLLMANTAWAYPVTITVQSDPPGLTPYPSVTMDGGVTDIPPGGAASFWVNPTAGWEWTANLYNLGGFGVNVADGGDPLCTPPCDGDQCDLVQRQRHLAGTRSL